MIRPLRRPAALVLLALLAGPGLRAQLTLPRLVAHGTAVQLELDGRPFLIRGGELGNSTATNPAYLKPLWDRFVALHLNTVLVPAYWDLLEPAPGRFDFSTVDAVLAQARAHDLHVVLLWFGSWKNSMSCYAPAWIKRDPQRYPRALDRDGVPQEILTPFSAVNRDADARAFAALLRHLREADARQHTVLMVQVENEIGMIPTARDHCPAAEQAYAGPVPAALLNLLESHRDEVAPQLRDVWLAAGARRAGTWPEVFGPGPAGEEIFMAWSFGRYTEAVAAAGKAEYPLPMYLNAALIRPGYQPGQYPSAGPLPQVADVWRLAAPNIDCLAPDIYFQDFTAWARRYHQPQRPFFIPETRAEPDSGVRALYAYGALDAIGFSPFSIENVDGATAENLRAVNAVVTQLEPLILAHQGDGTMAGLIWEGPEEKQPQQLELGGYRLRASFDPQSGGTAVPAGGLVIATGPDEFVLAGTATTVTFSSLKPHERVGILSAEEGRFVNGQWQNTLWLGGDQTNQGRWIKLDPDRISLQRVKLYPY